MDEFNLKLQAISIIDNEAYHLMENYVYEAFANTFIRFNPNLDDGLDFYIFNVYLKLDLMSLFRFCATSKRSWQGLKDIFEFLDMQLIYPVNKESNFRIVYRSEVLYEIPSNFLTGIGSKGKKVCLLRFIDILYIYGVLDRDYSLTNVKLSLSESKRRTLSSSYGSNFDPFCMNRFVEKMFHRRAPLRNLMVNPNGVSIWLDKVFNPEVGFLDSIPVSAKLFCSTMAVFCQHYSENLIAQDVMNLKLAYPSLYAAGFGRKLSDITGFAFGFYSYCKNKTHNCQNFLLGYMNIGGSKVCVNTDHRQNQNEDTLIMDCCKNVTDNAPKYNGIIGLELAKGEEIKEFTIRDCRRTMCRQYEIFQFFRCGACFLRYRSTKGREDRCNLILACDCTTEEFQWKMKFAYLAPKRTIFKTCKFAITSDFCSLVKYKAIPKKGGLLIWKNESLKGDCSEIEFDKKLKYFSSITSSIGDTFSVWISNKSRVKNARKGIRNVFGYRGAFCRYLELNSEELIKNLNAIPSRYYKGDELGETNIEEFFEAVKKNLYC